MTNFEKIMQDITVEELARRLGHINISLNGCPKGIGSEAECEKEPFDGNDVCFRCWKRWLNQEAK